MKALVTGSAGFVGRHMVWELVRRGYEVFGVDIKDRAVNSPPYSTGYTHLKADCRRFFAGSTERFDLVVHLAAIVGGRTRIDHDPLGVATDLSVDSEMFNWALHTRQDRVIYYSSSAAYPTHLQEKNEFFNIPDRLRENIIDFNSPIVGWPDATYGWSKLTGEVLAHHATQQGMRVHVFRPFSGYGDDQDLDYPFSSFIQRAAQGANPFVVWGDGTQVRDWIHIDDVIAGTFAFVDADNIGPVNLCTGHGTSFSNFAEICLATGIYHGLYSSSPVIEYKKDAPRGVTYRVGSPTLMHTLYTPYVNFKVAVRRSIERALERR